MIQRYEMCIMSRQVASLLLVGSQFSIVDTVFGLLLASCSLAGCTLFNPREYRGRTMTQGIVGGESTRHTCAVSSVCFRGRLNALSASSGTVSKCFATSNLSSRRGEEMRSAVSEEEGEEEQKSYMFGV